MLWKPETEGMLGKRIGEGKEKQVVKLYIGYIARKVIKAGIGVEGWRAVS